MAFEMYKPGDPKKPAGRRGTKFVRFHKGGLYVSSVAAEEIHFNEFDRARLWVDHEHRLVAFQMTNEPANRDKSIVNASRGGYGFEGTPARSINSTEWAREAFALGYRPDKYCQLEETEVDGESLWMVTK